MTVQRYASPNANTVWPEWSGLVNGQLTQRNLIVGEVWPAGEIDEVSTRYIQFGITAAEGTVLHIDSIGLYVCGAGGNGMRCRVSYSTDPDFAQAVSIAEYTSSMVAQYHVCRAVPACRGVAGRRDAALARLSVVQLPGDGKDHLSEPCYAARRRLFGIFGR